MADAQLAPTDAEIKDLYAEQTGFILDDSPAALLDFARAVLARWGAQQMPASAAEFALNVLVAAGHVSQELVDRALALPGAPQPAHSGEPVGYLYCGGICGDELADWEIVAEQLQCDRLNEHQGSLGKEAKLPLYTAPQPVERELLTDEQWQRIADLTNSILTRATKDEIERVIGIKGGQNADT